MIVSNILFIRIKHNVSINVFSAILGTWEMITLCKYHVAYFYFFILKLAYRAMFILFWSPLPYLCPSFICSHLLFYIFALFVLINFLSTWYKPENLGKWYINWGSVSMRLACRQVCGSLYWLKIYGKEPMILWAVSSWLGVPKFYKTVIWATHSTMQEALLCGFCFSSNVQVLAWVLDLIYLNYRLWYVCIRQINPVLLSQFSFFRVQHRARKTNKN